MNCIVMGCTNEVVRRYERVVAQVEADVQVAFGVCAFHGQSIIRHGTDEMVRDYLFPDEPS